MIAWISTLALAAILLLSACGEDDKEAAGVNVLQIRIFDDGLDPSEVTLRVPDVMNVTVINNSNSDCEFNVGPYVNALDVPAGESASIDFTVTEFDPQPERAEMGCGAGDSRSGEVVILTSTA